MDSFFFQEHLSNAPLRNATKIVSQWKGEIANNASRLFEKKTKSSEDAEIQKEEILNPVYKEVGKLQVENEWLKKKLRPYL